MVERDRYEKEIWEKGYKYICSIDEAGCGCLAGNCVVACVIFPSGFDYKKLLPGINDSKQLTAEKREALYPLIKQHALAWAVEQASVERIDAINIYWAKFEAVRVAISKLTIEPDFVIMDGNKKVPEIQIPQLAIVKGDYNCFSVGAASVLAKVDRDRHIVELSKNVHPDYGWAENKGYYTEGHIAALKKHGKTEWHRQKYVEKFIGGW